VADIALVVLSDLHYGNMYFSEKHFHRTIDYIRRHPNTYCFLNGDLIEAVTKTSKGDVFRQVGTIDDQRDRIIEWLMPVRDRILGSVSGNHEHRIYESVGVDIAADIARALGVPYRAEGMLYKLSLGDGNARVKGRPYVFWLYFTHGYGGARTKAAKAVKAERAGHWLHVDLVAMSHDHVVDASPDIYLVPDSRGTIDENGFLSGKVSVKRKMLVKTNAYLKWGGYAETKGFPPSDLTTPIISLLTPDSKLWSLYPERPKQAVKVTV